MPVTSEPARLFTPEEISAVLSHYELGDVTSVRELIGGGAGSPKAYVECARGRFVLKRRAPGRANPFRVAYAHEIMLRLRARGFDAAPTLVGTRGENNSMLQLEGRVYELFVFVEGRAFGRRIEQARAAGSALARVHALLDGFETRQPDPPARPDAVTLVRRAADAVHADALGRELEDLVRAASITGEGRPGIVHGDWHPGNLLFRDDAVVGVFDFDSARRAPRADDVAQGLVQFSMTRAGASPDEWPDEPDVDLATTFLAGYSGDGERTTLTPDAAPARMIRSLATEWSEAAIGGLLGGQEHATRLLGAVVRKARWLTEHAESFARAIRPPS
ncbi:MAG: phosphotransferase [Phycisphaerales bacterium]